MPTLFNIISQRHQYRIAKQKLLDEISAQVAKLYVQYIITAYSGTPTQDLSVSHNTSNGTYSVYIPVGKEVLLTVYGIKVSEGKFLPLSKIWFVVETPIKGSEGTRSEKASFDRFHDVVAYIEQITAQLGDVSP